MVDYRLWFHKRGDSRYISHLDLSRCMQRALKRSGLPVWYTEGFNPHVYVTFALPLSLGQESVCEILDFRLDDTLDPAAVLAALQPVMPPDLPAVKCAYPVQKTREIGAAVYAVTLPGEAARAEEAAAFLAQPSLVVRKHTKKGGEKDWDIAPFLSGVACRAEGKDLLFDMILPAGSEQNLNPALILTAWEGEGTLPPAVRILRTGVLDKAGRPFA